MTDRYSKELSDMLADQWWHRKALGAHAALFSLAEDAGSHWRGLLRPSVLWVDHSYAAGKGVLMTIEVCHGESFKDAEPVLEAILDRGLEAAPTTEDVNDFWAWRQWSFWEMRRKLPEHPNGPWRGWTWPTLNVRVNVKSGAACLVKVETPYQPGAGKLLCPGDPGYDEELKKRAKVFDAARNGEVPEPSLLDVDAGHPFEAPMKDIHRTTKPAEEIPF